MLFHFWSCVFPHLSCYASCVKSVNVEILFGPFTYKTLCSGFLARQDAPSKIQRIYPDERV